MSKTLHRQHIKKEYKIGIHSCGFCSYQTKSTYAITQHLKRHRIDAPSHSPFDCASSTPQPYTCDSCPFQSQLIVNFNKHVIPDAFFDWTDTCETFVCKRCDFKTFSKLMFMKHVYDRCVNKKLKYVARLPYNQMNANYRDHNNDYLKCHRFLKCIPYDNIRWLKCQHCSYQAEMKGDLKKHMGMHYMLQQRIQWFECEQCLFNVKQIFYLREHLLTKHLENVSCFDC